MVMQNHSTGIRHGEPVIKLGLIGLAVKIVRQSKCEF